MEPSTSRVPEDGDKVDVDLYVGRKFSSYADCQSVLDARSSLWNEKWRTKHSQTVGARNKVVDKPELHLPDKLKYYSVTLRCIHEGERVPSTSTGKRPRG